jgi:hypothetical protein
MAYVPVPTSVAMPVITTDASLSAADDRRRHSRKTCPGIRRTRAHGAGSRAVGCVASSDFCLRVGVQKLQKMQKLGFRIRAEGFLHFLHFLHCIPSKELD